MARDSGGSTTLRLPAQHRLLVQRAVEEVWNRGDLEVADELFAPTYRNHGGLIPDLVQGPEAIKVSVALYRAAFPGLRLSVEELQADGEMIVLRWTATNDREAVADVSAAGGGAGRVMGTLRSRLACGKIGETWTAWDQETTLRRLEIIPDGPD